MPIREIQAEISRLEAEINAKHKSYSDSVEEGRRARTATGTVGIQFEKAEYRVRLWEEIEATKLAIKRLRQQERDYSQDPKAYSSRSSAENAARVQIAVDNEKVNSANKVNELQHDEEAPQQGEKNGAGILLLVVVAIIAAIVLFPKLYQESKPRNDTPVAVVVSASDLRNIADGFGKYAISEIGTYEGNLSAGLFHGYGKIDWEGGGSYEGDWLHGSINGYGTLHRTNGDVYVGEFAEGVYHGQGELTYADSCVYVGDFFSGYRHGKGVYTYQDGEYTGDWVEDNMTGEGVLVRSNGDHYEGEFLDGYYHGQGKLVYGSGIEVHEGLFVEGVYQE